MSKRDDSPPTLRCAIYTRKSTEDGLEQEFNSLDAQRDAGEAYIASQKSEGWVCLPDRYDDGGFTGGNMERPAMRKLRKVVDLGGVQRIYAVALDRVTRSMRDAVVLLDEFEKAGVELCLVHQPELTFGAQGRFLRHVLAAFAEFERDMIATRIAESRAYLKKHGRRLAGKVPYGYDADPTTKQLVPDPTEALRVAEIFRRAADGQVARQVADDINDLGWPTKVYHSKRSDKTTGGGKWTARQINDMLRNPVYVGRFADGDDTRDGCHDAIVDEATFDAVQEQLDSRRTTNRKKRTRHDQLCFRQKVVCPQCGRFLTTYQTTKKTSDTSGIKKFFYACRSTAGGQPRCKGISYPAWDMEQAVRQMFDDPEMWLDLLGPEATDRIAEKMAETWRILPWTWQREWLKDSVTRIEIDEDDSTLSITFSREAVKSVFEHISPSDKPGG